MRCAVLLLSTLLAPVAPVRAAGVRRAPAPAPAPPRRIASLEVLPGEVVIDRSGATQRLVVLAHGADGSVTDVTTRTEFRPMTPAVVSISGDGILSAQWNGTGRVRVTLATAPGIAATVPVTVRNAGAPVRWDFSRQVVPVLTRGGCFGGNCHGAMLGRGGFKLSLFGQDPELDYETLVQGAGGRRVNRLNPGASLMLLKATATLPHGGGRRFSVGSPEYRLLARWIASGAPRGRDTVQVERLEVLPRDRLLSRPGEAQRLVVMAHFSDGTREDVTDQALIESRNQKAVEISGDRMAGVGLGEAVVQARYGGRTAAAKVVATSLPPLRTFPQYPPTHLVDREVFGRLRRLHVPPAEPADEHEWVRRLYLDLAGRIPTAAETERFCSSTEPGKREALIDALLNGPEFPKQWRDNLNALLMGRAAFPVQPTWGAWLETCLKEDRGWDRITRDLLLARPEKPEENGSLYFLDARFAQGETGLDTATRDVSRIFFGVDIQCARCHTHPDVTAWQQNAYWGLAAFFGRSYRVQVKGAFYLGEKATGEVQYFGADKNQRPAVPQFLTGVSPQEPTVTAESAELYVVPPEEAKEKTRVPVPKYSRRARFVELAVNAENPYFTRAIVNWVWATLMGRGLVDPIDQMHAGNPPSHPELLDALSGDFARSGYSLRKLIRTVVTSRAYALSSEWKPTRLLPERPGAELYAVAAVRPLSMQQLAHSVLTAAGYREQLAGGEIDPDGGKLRVKLETDLAPQIAEIRKNLDSGTETFQPSVAQALYLANNGPFQQLLERGGLTVRLVRLPDDGEVIRQAYLAVLSRPPAAEEEAAFRQHLKARAERRSAAVSQIVWALVTSSEFRFIH